jgi:hypothetical protein
MEFWNDIATDGSWKVLIWLKKEVDFILIGGWACYLLTKTMKSKDVDIIVDYETLAKMKSKRNVKKTPFLKKYETKIDEISVDVYVPFYSEFVIPIEYIIKNVRAIEGFKVPVPEILLILKQQAELERMHSAKGEKDRVDILNILINANVDFEKYADLTKKFKIEKYKKRLREIILGAKKEFGYLGLTDLRKVKLIKRDLLGKLK